MRKSLLVLSIAALVALFSTTAFAAIANDEVTSIKLREADGTSGQNTNSGSGVKTGHIQDGAVTTNKIADGAVTDAKITGPISASKISTSGLNADMVDGLHGTDLAPAVHSHPTSNVTGLDAALAGKSDVTHNHDVLYQQKYGKVAVVAQTGGDYTDPVLAMADIATWCGTPSATNPCLLKIMPGVYDLGSGSLDMQSYVNVEGSGSVVTKLIGRIAYSTSESVNNSELKSLTASIVYLSGSASMAIYDMNVESYMMCAGTGTASVRNSRIDTYYNQMGCHSLLDTVTINSSSTTAVRNNGATSVLEMSNVTVTGGSSHGVMNSAWATAKIKNSSIGSSPYYLYNIFGAITYITTSQLSGASYNTDGVLQCSAVFDANNLFLAAGCP